MMETKAIVPNTVKIDNVIESLNVFVCYICNQGQKNMQSDRCSKLRESQIARVESPWDSDLQNTKINRVYHGTLKDSKGLSK